MVDKHILDEMIRLAKNAIKFSYSPYSKFPVSSVVRTKNGKYYTGVNIENASYGLTICAERIAVFKAVSEGDKEIEKILIYTPTDEITAPCGACRQVIAEFNINTEIIMVSNKKIVVKNLKELLPLTFTREQLIKRT